MNYRAEKLISFFLVHILVVSGCKKEPVLNTKSRVSEMAGWYSVAISGEKVDSTGKKNVNYEGKLRFTVINDSTFFTDGLYAVYNPVLYGADTLSLLATDEKKTTMTFVYKGSYKQTDTLFYNYENKKYTQRPKGEYDYFSWNIDVSGICL